MRYAKYLIRCNRVAYMLQHEGNEKWGPWHLGGVMWFDGEAEAIARCDQEWENRPKWLHRLEVVEKDFTVAGEPGPVVYERTER